MIGEIRMLAGTETPPGWACCDGQLLSIQDYKSLFSVLGATYGGDGRTTFALPDLRGRTPIHAGKGAYRLGKTGGETTHELSVDELPGHSHDALAFIGAETAKVGAQSVVSSSPVATLAEQEQRCLFGIGAAAETVAAEGHDNLQPYLVVTYVIALYGATPSRK
jgi:microcystin-dependent protein